MGARQCWTCLKEHDPDEACPYSPMARAAGAAGGERAVSAPFPDDSPKFGPIFMATYAGEDSCCGEGIVEGEDIRSDGQGGWIHADDGCERMVQG